MKIGTTLPSLAALHPQEDHAQQTQRAIEPQPAPAPAPAPLTLAVQPRSRGIHPFLAMTLGEKGCASSSTARAGDDYSSHARRTGGLDSFAVEARDVNRNNICAGLSTEWLVMSGSGNAESRMDHLDHGGEGQSRGAQRHQVYNDALASALANDDEAPFFSASTAVIEDAGFSLRRAPKTVPASGDSNQLARTVATDVAQAGRMHLLSLRFANVEGHAIACSCEGGRFKLFDPNLGEFQSSRSAAPQLLGSLMDHYKNLNYDVACVNEFRVA